LLKVDKAFQNFAAGLVPPRESLNAAIEKSEQVSKWAKQKLKLTGTFYGGSYRRGTAMPLDSLRLHLLLSQKYYYDFNENSTKLLSYIRKRIAEDYSDPVIGEGGTVVRLKSADAVDLDLVLSIKLTRGGYLVPNGHGGWYKTNPSKEEKLFRNKEDASSGRFLALAKLIKAWNLYTDSPFNSYYLELVVYYRVNDFVKLYSDLVFSVYSSMSLFLPEFLNCPAVGEIVSSGTQVEARHKHVEKAYNLAKQANGEKNSENAILLWGSLFGENFGRSQF